MKSSIALVLVLALVACHKDQGATGAASSGPATSAPVKTAAPAPTFDVAFKGTYKKTAKVAFRNGQRVRTDSGQGTATLTVEPGKVTYHVEYPLRAGGTGHVTETYTFAQSDMRTIPEGTDVTLTFQKMDSDDRGYSPDSKDAKIEARKQATGYEIGFLYRDTNGTQAGIEFR